MNLMTIEESVIGSLPEVSKVNSVFSTAQLDAEKNFAIQQLYKNEVAVNTAQKNPVSVQNAIINLAAIGISLNPATKHAYLVPRDGMICLDVSYMGLMHLAQECGSIQWAQAKIVYENDTYENQGLTKEPIHKQNPFGNKGQKIGVYCTAKLANGDFMTHEMSADQVLEVRAKSKAAQSQYSPWNTFEEEMWRKTVVKRASKYWPKVSDNRFDKAVHVINEHEGLEDNTERKAELVKKLHEYASDNHTPLELYGFLRDVQVKDGEEMHIWLYSQFEKGRKVKDKEKAKEGKSQFFDYLEIFKNGSKDEMEECEAEMTDLEYKIVTREIK